MASFTIFSIFIIFFFFYKFDFASTTTQKHTHLHFYLHDIVTGPNPTAVKVVPKPNNASAIVFGDITVIDDLLTEGPNATTKHVGHAQGIYVATSQQTEPALLFTAIFVFEEGKFNGSTLSVLARDAILSPVRELPVVGGTGKFRMARGYALLKTYTYNMSSGDAILELDVYVWHHSI